LLKSHILDSDLRRKFTGCIRKTGHNADGAYSFDVRVRKTGQITDGAYSFDMRVRKTGHNADGAYSFDVRIRKTGHNADGAYSFDVCIRKTGQIADGDVKQGIHLLAASKIKPARCCGPVSSLNLRYKSAISSVDKPVACEMIEISTPSSLNFAAVA